jgi:hypothetical protein
MRKLALKKVVLRDLDAPAQKLQGLGSTEFLSCFPGGATCSGPACYSNYTCEECYPQTMSPCPHTEGECFSYDPYTCWTNNQSYCYGTCFQYTCPYTCANC